MNPQSQPVNGSQNIRSVHDDTRTVSSRPIRDLRHRDVFVIDSKPTR
jgi:hypothetical protein